VQPIKRDTTARTKSSRVAYGLTPQLRQVDVGASLTRGRGEGAFSNSPRKSSIQRRSSVIGTFNNRGHHPVGSDDSAQRHKQAEP
jgi:hypothetical protein